MTSGVGDCRDIDIGIGRACYDGAMRARDYGMGACLALLLVGAPRAFAQGSDATEGAPAAGDLDASYEGEAETARRATSRFVPPARRPWIELVGGAGVALPGSGGAKAGHALSLAVLGRPLPYLGLGAFYEYVRRPWHAHGGSGTEVFDSPHEQVWGRTLGGLLRGYALAHGRMEPYAELGVGKTWPRATLHDPTCTTLDHALALRFALGVDTYVLPFARVGLSASATAEFSEGYSCNLMILSGPQPPNPPPPAVFVLGLTGTLGFPARAASTARSGDSR